MPTPRATLTIADVCAVIGDAGFGQQPPGIGLELEWFVTRDGVAVTDLEAIRAAVAGPGALPYRSRITFEPGGQIEISAPPSDSGPTAVRGAERDALTVMARLADAGMRAIAIGLDAGATRPRVIDEPRYRAMAQYFAQRGTAGARMMCATASMQINVGFTDDVDRQWELAHDLAPILGAIFAHSPLLCGRPSGWQSSRLAVWAALDPARTSPVAARADARNDWTRYALDAPIMLVNTADDCLVPPTTLTLRDWVGEGHAVGHPTVDDVVYHLTTLFPPIRPRGWLELRVLDALPHPWWQVAAAIAITALTDPELGTALVPIVRGCRDLALNAAWWGVHDPAIGATACRVLDAVLPALAPAGYDAELVAGANEFAGRYTHRGRSLADDRLDAWHAHGTLVPDPEPLPTTVTR
jgi:glutamate--cysteine ligase